MATLTIRSVMTTTPHSIGRDQPLRAAAQRMRQHGIRHLPVLEGGRLVGILSERDIALVESLPNVDLDTLEVAEAMTATPYTVHPDTPLAAVAATMAERKYGTVVVEDGGAVVGIFTAVDAMRELARLLASAQPR